MTTWTCIEIGKEGTRIENPLSLIGVDQIDRSDVVEATILHTLIRS